MSIKQIFLFNLRPHSFTAYGGLLLLTL